MSDPHQAYENGVREMRERWGVDAAKRVNWQGVDEGLFERVNREERERRARLVKNRASTWGYGLASLAAAAAVGAMVLGGERRLDPAADGPAPISAGEDRVAGVISAIEGRALVNGVLLGRGVEIHVGDVIEASGRVTLDRPGRLTLVLEPDSAMTVTHVRGSLVVALQRGAVEASVVPVPSGEAFAVDIDHSRIAVHGTHLRVTRTGSHAVVDLREGVVAIGRAPRVGAVLGTLLTAPAHAELDAADPEGTLRVIHDASAVNLPAALSASPALAPTPLSPGAVRLDPTARAGLPTVPRADGHPASSSPLAPSAPSSSALASPAGALVSDDESTAALAAAVRACMADRTPAENVTVVVATTLTLKLQDDGSVRSARFEPPVAPEVNECATPAIYKARFTHGGVASLVLSYISR